MLNRKECKLLMFLSVPLFIIGAIVGEYIGVFYGKNIMVYLPVFFQHILFSYPFFFVILIGLLIPIENTYFWSKFCQDRVRKSYELTPFSPGVFLGIIIGIEESEYVVSNLFFP